MLQRLLGSTVQRAYALVQALNRAYLIDPAPAVPPLAPDCDPDTLALYEALVGEPWFHPTFRLLLQCHLLGLPTAWLWDPSSPAERRRVLLAAFRRLPKLVDLHPDHRDGSGGGANGGSRVFLLAVQCRDQLDAWLDATA